MYYGGMTDILVQALYTNEYALQMGLPDDQSSFTESMRIDDLLSGVRRSLPVEEVYVQVKTDDGVSLKKVGKFVVHFEPDSGTNFKPSDESVSDRSVIPVSEPSDSSIENDSSKAHSEASFSSDGSEVEAAPEKKPSLLRRVVGR